MTNLRVWNIVNPPARPEYWEVSSVEEAKQLIETMYVEHLVDAEILQTRFGLEEYARGEWCEWTNADGDCIDDLMEDLK